VEASKLQSCTCSISYDRKNNEGFNNAGVAEIYYATVEASLLKYKSLLLYLSEEEREKAAKFRFDNNRALYIVSHAVLNKILSLKTGIPVHELVFKKNQFGKPYLEGIPVAFNLSHSMNYFAIIVSDTGEVGIDIEGDRRLKDYAPIMRNYYTLNETAFVNRQKNEEKPAAFYKIWTRKEALLKAMGFGLIDNLRELETSSSSNKINPAIFPDKSVNGNFYYIYSVRLRETYLSLATDRPVEPFFNLLNESSLGGVFL